MLTDFFLDEPTTENEKLVSDALKRYFTYQSEADIGKKVGDYVFGGDDREEGELRRRDLKLGIQQKRRALGLPQDDEDYDEAVNDGLAFKNKGVLAAFGIKASEKMPDPSFLRPKLGAITSHEPPSSMINSLLGSVLGVGGKKYAGIPGTVGRFIRRA